MDLPPDVHAALDAYLAARADDATWIAYVNSLGPGVALDVATDICEWTLPDDRAVGWIARLFEPDPDDSAAALRILPPRSRSLDALLRNTSGLTDPLIELANEVSESDAGLPQTWVVTLSREDWESEGRVTRAEARQWWDAHTGRSVVWAVAACRAVCLAWSPEWARAQAEA